MPRYNTRHQARLRAAGEGVEKEHRREKESTVKTTQTAGPAKRARRRVSPRGAQHGPSTEAKPPRRTVDTRGNRRRRHHKQQERYCNDDDDDGDDDDDDYDSSELRSKRHKDAEQQHTVAVDTRKPHGGDGTSQQKRQPTPDNSNPVPATPANQNPPKRKSITPRTGKIMKIEANIAIYEAQIEDYQSADSRATTQWQRVQANLATCEENIKALKSFDQLLQANQAKLQANQAKLEANEQDLKENQKEQLNWRVKLDAAQQAGNSAREANAQAAIDLLAKAEQRLETEDKRLRRENADIISSEADIRARKEARQRELEAEKQELEAQVTKLTGQLKESQTARAELQAEIGESHLACRQPPSPLPFIRPHLPACT